MRFQSLVRRTVRWLLLVAILMYVVSGFGITESRTVESLTSGLLTKPAAFEIHNSLLIPFLVLLIVHTCYPLLAKAISLLRGLRSLPLVHSFFFRVWP